MNKNIDQLEKYENYLKYRKLCRDFNFCPKNKETGEIKTQWEHFPAGTNEDEILNWLSENSGENIIDLQYGLLDNAIEYLLQNIDDAIPNDDRFTVSIGTAIDAEHLLIKTMKLVECIALDNYSQYKTKADSLLAEYKMLKGE